MKDFIYKIWNWLVGLLNKVRRDRIYHFVAGLLVALFCLFVLKMYLCLWPVLFVALIKEFVDNWVDGNFDCVDLLATVLGGLVVQAFVWICVSPGVPFVLA